nr:phospho-sugar mutase [uncultured Oribacterium sp.]
MGNQEYERWCALAKEESIQKSLENYTEEEIEDAFYQDLKFGTGGLRGIMGAGTNRMNIYTVAKASQGLAQYLHQNNSKQSLSVVIGFDSRLQSNLFAETAASVFAANRIHVHIWPFLTPVPTVSFATRTLKASAGIMITASHNPKQYNGYKVYGEDGCQITPSAALKITEEIDSLDIFKDIKKEDFHNALTKGEIEYIDQTMLDRFLETVKKQSVLYGDNANKTIQIVYTPLNGSGYIPVYRVLKETGFQNINVVEEQQDPDGNFPTCPYPNPEIKESLELGLQYCKKNHADLLLATDPDCDRVGIAIKNTAGDYTLLSGNETGILLLDYICMQRRKHHKIPKNPLSIKTIVSTDMGKQIAEYYDIKMIDVLTGFKYIGEQISNLEKKGEEERFIFGFEESCGYLSGAYVRDKDAVGASLLICEMFAYYQAHNMNLYDRLQDLYRQFGYYLNTLHSFSFDGPSGLIRMQEIMQRFREKAKAGTSTFSGMKVIKVLDYIQGIDHLPSSNVLKFLLEQDCSIVVRPSGTEPKLKVYLSIKGTNAEDAEKIEKLLLTDLQSFMRKE